MGSLKWEFLGYMLILHCHQAHSPRLTQKCRLTIKDLNIDVRLPDVSVNFVPVVVKGGYERLAYFGQSTAEHIQDWLEVRQAKPGVSTLFVGWGGHKPLDPLTRSGVGSILERLSNMAGIDKATPHSLQRSFAVLAEEAGASTRKTQAWGRWSDIKMVEHYTQALRVGRLYGQYSPIDYVERDRT